MSRIHRPRRNSDPAMSGSLGPEPSDLRRRVRQLEALAFTPLRTATVLSFVFAACSSLRFVVRKRTTSS